MPPVLLSHHHSHLFAQVHRAGNKLVRLVLVSASELPLVSVSALELLWVWASESALPKRLRIAEI